MSSVHLEGAANGGSGWRGMWRFLAWGEPGICDAFQLVRDDEAGEFPRLVSRKRIRLISLIRGKSPTGKSQHITSSSNPSRKHALRAASCQLTASSKKSSTYLSNLRPPYRKPHSASSAEVIFFLLSDLLSRCVRQDNAGDSGI